MEIVFFIIKLDPKRCVKHLQSHFYCIVLYIHHLRRFRVFQKKILELKTAEAKPEEETIKVAVKQQLPQ